MAKQIKIISSNCRGLADKNKRKEVMNLFRKKYSIVCLQDIHISLDNVNTMKSEWGLQCIIAPFKNNSRGVAILFNNDIDFTIHRTIIDVNGNFISTDLTVEDKRFTLTNLYGPNTDDPYFYRKVFENIQDLGNESTVIVGDWNLVLDPSVDLENYKHINNPKAREEVLKYLEYFNLFDIWRDLNNKEKKYTWW